jgi:peptidoglycan hydrolase-like protein with peptidoglycan-binding domain
MRDDVVIVDHDHRIVAVMPVGSSAAQRGGGSVSLSQSEIREVQMKLNQKGFNVGEPDGVMGPKTRDGLAQFQRQEGLKESGNIDSQTADALGISNAPSTTGSAPRDR